MLFILCVRACVCVRVRVRVRVHARARARACMHACCLRAIAQGCVQSILTPGRIEGTQITITSEALQAKLE